MRSTLLLLLIGCAGDTTPAVVPTSQPTPEEVQTGETDEVLGILAAHNTLRASLDIPALTYDAGLAQTAADWAVVLDDENCIIRHDFSSPLGENLYWSSGQSTPENVVDSWASEVADYDYDSNSCTPGAMCGHYTQIVWADTERVGCAVHTCSGNGGEIWMCTYDPAGNFVGQHPY